MVVQGYSVRRLWCYGGSTRILGLSNGDSVLEVMVLVRCRDGQLAVTTAVAAVCMHYWRLWLCRVFLHSTKSPLHSVKALPSVALGKVRSAKFFSAKGLCRVLFIGALGKIKNNFAECLGRHSAKYFRSFHRSRLFC